MSLILTHVLTVTTIMGKYCNVLMIFHLFFLTELKEQLLARSSRVEDLERLKTEFNFQKREIKEQNEAELESLRR